MQINFQEPLLCLDFLLLRFSKSLLDLNISMPHSVLRDLLNLETFLESKKLIKLFMMKLKYNRKNVNL